MRSEIADPFLSCSDDLCLAWEVPLTLFNTASTRANWHDDAEVAAFLAACKIFLTKQRPDVVWTYGFDPVSLEIQRLVMWPDIPLVFSLDDAVYCDESMSSEPTMRLWSVPSTSANFTGIGSVWLARNFQR